MGNHIDVMSGKWTAQDSGIGAGVDSYFEYLLKGGILFGIPRLVDMFKGKDIFLGVIPFLQSLVQSIASIQLQVRLFETIQRYSDTKKISLN